ncbi:DUF305 domain-containing protein [Nocardioides sp.]|uniref:DUF305 domain-containing protein n=1 Tax=Nocardioides sp. TaxID=35761 RepID=UPI00351537F6
MAERRTRAGVIAVGVALVLGLGVLLGRVSAPDVAGPAPAPGAPAAVDVGFAQDMAAHHDQAVLMAGLALTRATPTVRAVAASILGTQSQELGLLRGWLRLWGEPGFAARPMAWAGSGASGTPGMSEMSGMAGMAAMPGAASTADLARLTRVTGAAFDRLFLQLMIRHHQGALLMVDDALALAPLTTTRAAAEGIAAAQLEEIGTMTAVLRSLGATPLPAP